MRLIGFLLRSSPWLLVSALASSLCTGFASTYLVSLVNELLTGAEAERGSLALRFALLSVSVLTLRWLSHTLFVRLSEQTLARLRDHLTRHIAQMQCRAIERQGMARLQALLTEDVGTVSSFFVTIPEIVSSGAVVLGAFIYLASLSVSVFAFAVGMLGLGSIGYHVANVRALTHLRVAREREDDLFRHFRSLVDGAKELKLHVGRRGAFMDGVLARTIDEVRRRRTSGLSIYVGATSWGTFLFFALIGLVVFVGYRVGLAPRVISGYALMFLYMMLPLEWLLSALPNINLARVALERITAFGMQEAPKPFVLPPPRASFSGLRLEGVTHRYQRDTEDGVFTLGPIDLELAPGEIVYLVGGNGSGKTTLAKLLTGLYEPEQGDVWLNGSRVTRGDEAAYHQYFSAIFSDFFLFDSVLGESRVGLDVEARALLARLQLDHKVQIEDGALSTIELSQGQRKRLALLVAYLEDRPVCVFDEWAADQDPIFKDLFYRTLLPELKASGKTAFVITHDDRYFHLADRVLKLESGKLVPPVATQGTGGPPRHASRVLSA